MTDRPAIEQDDDHAAGGFGTLGSAMQLLVVAWAAVIASFPLNDNSFFTHLATGRIILDEGSVPSSDPYTFTANGVDWTVQSWLASLAYAGAERLAGELGLRLLILSVFVIAALLLWRLSRPAESLLIRLGVVSGALFVATGLWSERPYMVGVIGLSVVWLALEGAVRPWLLVPLFWVWANSHGSYPLGLALAVAVIAGEALDRRRCRIDESPSSSPTGALRTELQALKAMVLGTLLSMIGPLGVDVLLFPVKAVTQSDVLSNIVEWQPPGFRSVPERMFLVLVLATVAGLVRDGRWRFALPTLLFVGGGVVAQRNVVMATMVLVPVLASCVPAVGTLTARTRPALGMAFTGFCAVAALLSGSLLLQESTWGLGAYPTAALSWLEENEPSGGLRVATQDRTGNLIGLLDGPVGSVFIDDRADMYPEQVFSDYVALVRGGPMWSRILDDYEIDAVLWERSAPLASLLIADDRWRTVFADGEWVVSCRRELAACGKLTT